MEFQKKYGPWAFIAGGSEGIGAEFARQLAAQGLNLVLLARDEPILVQAAQQIQQKYQVEVKTLRVDLTQVDLFVQIQPTLDELEIGLLVYNAAAPLIGEFLDYSWEEHQNLLQINVFAPAQLVHYLGQKMKAQKKGGIILLSSMAGRQGTAMIAHYAASKAYNLVLAESLWEELRNCGIDVLGVCPGTTRTPGWERSQARLKGLIVPPIQEPQAVVQAALKALGKKPSLITGFWNRLSAFALKMFFTRKQTIQIISQNTRKMYDKSQ